MTTPTSPPADVGGAGRRCPVCKAHGECPWCAGHGCDGCEMNGNCAECAGTGRDIDTDGPEWEAIADAIREAAPPPPSDRGER